MKKTKIPNIVNLAILTVVTTVFWIVFEVIRTLTLKPDTYVSPAVIKSLSPELDTKLLDEIREKLYFDEGTKIVLPLTATVSGEVSP